MTSETTSRKDAVLPSHPHIPADVISLIHSKFCSIDNVLMLHYSNHSSDPLLNKILVSASDLARVRITMKDIQVIFEISDEYYTIYKLGSELYLKFSSELKSSLLLSRRSDFSKSILLWIEQNQQIDSIPLRSVSEIIKKTELVSGSIKKPDHAAIAKKVQSQNSLSSKLKNESSKFKFQQREELVERQKSGGLSLLERIKLKEKTNSEHNDLITPKMKYDKYLLGKCPVVYDIIHHTQPESSAVSLAKIVQTVQDSVAYPLAADEVRDTIQLISERVNDITVVSRNGIQVVKIGALNRDRDLKKLAPEQAIL